MDHSLLRRFPRLSSSCRTRAATCSAGLLILSASLCLPALATAAGSAALQITHSRKPYFVFATHAGVTVHGSVTVINLAKTPSAFLLYPTDATTGQTSGAVYQSAQHSRRDVGAWINLSAHTVRLKSHQSEVVPFSMTVPAGARAGQHLGGIVAETALPEQKLHTHRHGSSFSIRIREQTVIAVEANLPDPGAPQMAITGASAGVQSDYQTVRIGLSNTGNTLTRGSGELSVSRHGSPRFNHSFALDTFVPHTHIDFPVGVTGRALTPGTYQASVRINYEGQVAQTRVPFTFTVKAKNSTRDYGAPALARVPVSTTHRPAQTHKSHLAAVGGGIVGVLAVLGLGMLIGRRGRSKRAATT